MNTQSLINHAKRLTSNKQLRRVALVSLGIFIGANILVLVAYRNRTYPNTVVGSKPLGSVSANQLAAKLRSLNLLPREVTFQQGKSSAKTAVANLGVSVDYQQLSAKSLKQRSWLPLANLWTSHNVEVSLKQDQSKVQQVLATSLTPFQRPPNDARIARQNDSFAVQPESPGQMVDLPATSRHLLESLSHGNARVAVSTKSVAATITGASLQDELLSLNKQSKTTITLQYNGQSKRLGAAEITALYTPNKSNMVVSDAAVLTAINNTGASWGIVVDNQQAAVDAIKHGLQNQKNVTVSLVAAPKAIKTIHYCTAVRGVSEAELPELNAKLQSTFADGRSWSLNGLVQFVRSDADCEMHVWLTAADQMASFGSICDALWSCAVHPNVVINYDRWTKTSDAWQKAGGSRDDYRSMVINHESGHWFGFYHAYCGGAGQPAPVMQQQSIDLQGCTFNPWPTASEQATLKQRLGL